MYYGIAVSFGSLQTVVFYSSKLITVSIVQNFVTRSRYFELLSERFFLILVIFKDIYRTNNVNQFFPASKPLRQYKMILRLNNNCPTFKKSVLSRTTCRNVISSTRNQISENEAKNMFKNIRKFHKLTTYLKYDNLVQQIIVFGFFVFLSTLRQSTVLMHWLEGCGQYIDQWSAVSRYTLALNPLSHAIIDPHY